MDASPGPGCRHGRRIRFSVRVPRRLAGRHGLRPGPGVGSLPGARCRGGRRSCGAHRGRSGSRSCGAHRSHAGHCRSGAHRSRNGHWRGGGLGSRPCGRIRHGRRSRSRGAGRSWSHCSRGGPSPIGSRCSGAGRHRTGRDGRCGSRNVRRHVSLACRGGDLRHRPSGGRYSGGRCGESRCPTLDVPRRRDGWDGRAWPCRGYRPVSPCGLRSGPVHPGGPGRRVGCGGGCRRSGRPGLGVPRRLLGLGRPGGRHRSSGHPVRGCPDPCTGEFRLQSERRPHHARPPGEGHPGPHVRRSPLVWCCLIGWCRGRRPRRVGLRSSASLRAGRSCRLRRCCRTFPVPQTRLPTFSLSGFQA